MLLQKSKNPQSPRRRQTAEREASIALTVGRSCSLAVKRRIDRIEIFGIQIVLRDADGIAKSLIMHELTLAQEFDRLADVGIVTQTQNVVVRRARLLLCYYHIFAMFLVFQKTRKILMFQGVSALLKLTIFQKFQ